MKAIILNTARVDNGGARRDAGEKVAIGEGKTQINLDAAKALVRDALAEDADKVLAAAERAEKADQSAD